LVFQHEIFNLTFIWMENAGHLGITGARCNHFYPLGKSNFVTQYSSVQNLLSMKNAMPFFLGFLTLTLLLFSTQSCNPPCPSCPETTALNPNPTIEFNVPNANFGVRTQAVPGATSVKLEVFGADNVLAATLTPAFNTLEPINVLSAPRPLKLVFTYNSSANTPVVVDYVTVDDRKNGGTPIMEILVAIAPGNPDTCVTGITNGVSLTPINPATSKFTWTPGKQYKITAGSETILLKTALNGQSGCFAAILYKQNSFSCLTNPTLSNNGSTEGQFTFGSSGTVKITGTDLCNNGTAREITLRLSGPTTVSVLSD